MEKYQDFKVVLPPDEWNSFRQELIREIDLNNWTRRDDLAERGNKGMSYVGKELLCVETPELKFNNEKLKGVIWMWLGDSQLEVFNIIPLIGNYLICAQYNFILSMFRQSIIDKMAPNYNLMIEMSKPYLDMEDVIGTEGLRLLITFSRTSNRSTGHSHPMDFAKWCNFIFYVFKNKKHLAVDDFMHWLIEDGWMEDKANELSLDYEYSIEMLERYEQNR